MANAVPISRGDHRPSCPSCRKPIDITYSRPLPGASGRYEKTGDCRNCGPVPLTRR